MSIDIKNRDYYEFNKPLKEKRTRERLKEIDDLGLEEVSYGQFGIKGSLSGLYIERIWSYDKKDWDDYIDWIKSKKHE